MFPTAFGLICSVAFVLLTTGVFALDNGLALTPPMGWLSWERFRCNLDCENDPDNCISEKLFKDMADRMASDGYKDAGYEYVILDDCWLATQRDAQGKLQADAARFPSGIKNLSDYVHSKGLKFGIYEDYGTETCAGYPGIIGHMEDDANIMAEWGVDYLKVDGCNSDPDTMDEGYPMMGKYLNATGRPIVYSCEWPMYQFDSKKWPNYVAIAETCNLWRNYHDVEDSWTSVLNILDHFIKYQNEFAEVAGPGGWNDPDMLIIGNFGLSYEQSKAQMALWAVMASPLLMSVDLRTIKDEYRDILQNKEIIAVNQDVLGIQGKRVLKNSKQMIEVWTKPVLPVMNNEYSYAIVFLSRRIDGMPFNFATYLNKLGLDNPYGYHVYDLYEQKEYGRVYPDTKLQVKINPTGVVMLRADVVRQNSVSVVRQFKK